MYFLAFFLRNNFAIGDTKFEQKSRQMDFTFKLQSPKAMNNISAWAGVLTCSPRYPAFPSPFYLKDSDNKNGQWLKELTAAGQLRILHRIPF